MRISSRLYALTLIAIGFALFGAVVAANVLIDPQRVFGLNLFPNKRNENLRYSQYLAYRKSEPSIGGLMFASRHCHLIRPAPAWEVFDDWRGQLLRETFSQNRNECCQ